MKYVLDTTTFSALMRGDEKVGERLRANRPVDIGVPQPVLAEIAYGVARLPQSRPREWLAERFAVFARALPRAPWTDRVSSEFGAIKAALQRAGNPIEDFDIAIAAHARAHDAVLVTSNLSHMARVDGLRLEDWAQP